MHPRENLHALVEALPESEVLAAERLLGLLQERGKDPLRAFLDRAPLDDEPLTDEDVREIREALAEARAGKLIPQEEVERLFLESVR